MKFNNKTIYVILRNKIIGIDSILPTCMEMHSRCGYRFNFISFESATYQYIMNDNIVIRDAINSIGKIELLSPDRYKLHYMSKIFFIFYFLKIAFYMVIKNNHIMHSAHLHVKPLVWIRWLFKKSNIIFMEKKSYGMDSEIDFTSLKNHDLKFIYNKRSTHDKFYKNNIDMFSHPPLLYAGTLIGYDKKWNYFKHPLANGLKNIVLKDMRNNSGWIDFINNNAHNYISREIPEYNFESKGILVFLATRITRETDSCALNEFVEALRLLSKYTETFPLFIKLHTFSDIYFINDLINIAMGDKEKKRCVFTKLHPAVLATKAVISAFSNSGTLMKEFSELGTPVVNLQINKGVLQPSYLESSIELSKESLEKRYRIREIFSDYTFSDVHSFDKFMKTVVKSSRKLDSESYLVNSVKNVTNAELCIF